MALRLVDVYLPDGAHAEIAPNEAPTPLARWDVTLTDSRRLVRVLLRAEETEAFVENLVGLEGLPDGVRIVMTAVEATVPRIEEASEEEAGGTEDDRISREELYEDVNDAISGTRVFYAMVVLSTVVAAGGMLRDNVAAVIGAMVIAPLMGPNIGLALGTTLGDTDLLRRALKINIGGVLLSLSVAVGIGLLLPVDPAIPELAARTAVNLSDIVLALAAGVAGALAMTRGVSTAFIGVMVAVALLPPLVAVGLLVGAGEWQAAYRAFLLLLTNVVSVNLAGVGTFLIQGIRPMSWYEAERAKKATRTAMLLWITALGLLIAAIMLAQEVAL